MNELRDAMPHAVARGEGREFFERILDGVMIAHKLEKGLPPSSPEEARQMQIAHDLSSAALGAVPSAQSKPS
jgi:hypothetical protein